MSTEFSDARAYAAVEKYAASEDRMNILAETNARGAGGGKVKSAAGVVYSDVPVRYEPLGNKNRTEVGEQIASLQAYVLNFAALHNGARMDVRPGEQRIVVQARGDKAAINFSILSVRDFAGAEFEVIAERKN